MRMESTTEKENQKITEEWRNRETTQESRKKGK